jgi:hypothetical protein
MGARPITTNVAIIKMVVSLFMGTSSFQFVFSRVQPRSGANPLHYSPVVQTAIHDTLIRSKSSAAGGMIHSSDVVSSDTPARSRHRDTSST